MRKLTPEQLKLLEGAIEVQEDAALDDGDEALAEEYATIYAIVEEMNDGQ